MSDRLVSPEGNLPNFDNMTPAEFERYLPDLFAASPNGSVSTEPRLQKFLAANPDCAALVRDLEAIAEAARALLDPIDAIEAEPNDTMWDNIRRKLADSGTEGGDFDPGLET